MGLPVARSQSKTPAGQKLRHSKSRRHTRELMVGNQGNRSRRLRIVGTAFSPKMIRDRTGPQRKRSATPFFGFAPLFYFSAQPL